MIGYGDLNSMTTLPVKPITEPIVKPKPQNSPIEEPEVLEPDKLCPKQGDEIVRRVEEDV